MIIRNNNDNLNFLKEETSIEREQLGKNSMDSFEKILINQANNMLSNGYPLDKVAQSFSMSKDALSSFLNQPKETPKQKEKVVKAESQDNGAQEAYDNLYGSKNNSKAPKYKTSKSVMQSRSAETDEGITNNNLKSLSNNSIWEPDYLEKKSKVKGIDEKLKAIKKQDKQRREEIRQSSKEETIDGEKLEDILKETETRKEQSISRLADAQGNFQYEKYIPQKGMSIFDNGNFDKISKKTKGEAIKKKATKKDRSWVKDPSEQQVSSNKILDKMIDNMLNMEDKK